MSHATNLINRWWITVRLATRSPLRIGSGATRQSSDIRPEGADGSSRMVEISSVETDTSGRPTIRGSSLKGCLRSWLEARLGPADLALVDTLFGAPVQSKSGHATAVAGSAGKAEFSDATLNLEHSASPNGNSVLTEREVRARVIVRGATAISRQRRTAIDRMLRNTESILPGTAFDTTILVRNATDAEISLLLWAVGQFDGTSRGPMIGAGTAHQDGRLHASVVRVRRTLAKDITSWIRSGASRMPVETAPTLSPDELKTLAPSAAWTAVASSGAARLELDVSLEFDGPVLVNDPLRAESTSNADFAPRRDDLSGVPIIPWTSMQGSLRAAAERILRTLSPAPTDDPHPYDATARPLTGDGSRPVNTPEGIDPSSELFGAAGWGAAFTCSTFELDPSTPAEAVTQEFVAIDRFTGGVAGARKFNAMLLEPRDPAVPLRFVGTMRLDLARTNPWAIALLALLWRDLVEGDVRFGSFGAKGAGHLRSAVLRNVRLTRPTVAWLETQAAHAGLSLARLHEEIGNSTLSPALRSFLGACFAEFHSRLASPATPCVGTTS